MALPTVAAGPDNRLRSVREVRVPRLGIYYLKLFRRTQAKNRLRFRLTHPRCHTDAEREAMMAAELRAAGIPAPRPVALGRDGHASSFLCARLPGTSLAELVRRGEVSDATARAVAEWCGGLLQRGFHLPDLSLDHVYLQPGSAALLGVLDLHNGTLARKGPAPLRLCQRVLRHVRRSALRLPVTTQRALRFAVRLLRAAGRGAHSRRILAAVPSLPSQHRYERPGKAAAYAVRNPTRGAAELLLLRRVWPGHPDELVLDVPCGTGRLLPFLREAGARVIQADAAWAMLQQARTQDQVAAVQASAVTLPFADRSTDGVVLFRFLHHLPPDLARIVLSEACRIARRFVVVSWFHPCSVHGLSRHLRGMVGQRTYRYAVTTRRLRRWLQELGFAPHATAAQRPFVQDFWVASFTR